ncbi:MAG: carboxylating nicotinate-nucleotide diphosphorylase [Hyphomicrobiales bacterium]
MRLEALALPMVRLALTEDVGGGDVTTDAVVDASARARAHIEAKQEGVLSGSAVATLAFKELDPDVKMTWSVKDGGVLRKGETVAVIEGRARAILTAERVALNFLQHLSGVATLTRAFTRALERTGVAVLDTRKTTPGLRVLEKVAVLAGGGQNHRFGLFDAVLVKENHVKAAGGIGPAVERAKASAAEKSIPVVVEARSVDEAVEAATLGVDRLLLDNFTPTRIAETLKRLGPPRDGRPKIEVSGGIRLQNVRDFALPGVDFVSIGALTHSAPALDLSLVLDEVVA